MEYKHVMLIICICTCILFSVSSVFANDAINETGYSDVGELQLSNDTSCIAGDSLSDSVVYFDASANDDGDGSRSNPYKYYRADRISFGGTAYFADGVYDITEQNSIHSSSAFKTTFIGQSMEKTVLRSKLANKFDFTVTDNSYFVLKDLTVMGVHINNQANLIAENVIFKDSEGFNPDYQPGLSYSHISKVYESTYGGVIICDTPLNKVTALNLTGCRFDGNCATSGGVIAACNSIANIQNCVFYNSSANRFGGAMYAIKSRFNIINSSFEISNAKYGGAIYSNGSSLYLKDSRFGQSQAFSFGGAIASFSSHLDINHVAFSDYASLEDAGGAIYTVWSTLNVADSSFKDGYSDFGGAICNLKCNSTITGCEFINNSATYYGGSIYNMYGNLALTGNVFEKSHAESGGSIFNRLTDSFNIINNRFTDSTADEGDIVFIDGYKVTVVERGNVHDTSLMFIKYGSVYDVDYYESVPLINYVPEPIDELPSSYDSRKYGYITSVKDQVQGGNCWAFSGIATLEACLKKATGITYDFSEENVKNLMYEYALFESDDGINFGGNLYMFIAYLAGWFGPTYDENDVYDDYSSLSVIYDSIIHVQNVYVLPERQNFYDNNQIKKAVMDYGAVSIAIDLSQGVGHAVTIVGWDDEFTSNDFLGNKAVGAWIIKNSWGTDWGYDGFGYLSYQQPFGYGYTFILDGDRGYTNVYQYDYAGKSGKFSIDGDEIYIKNRFTAKDEEILSAFSTYFDEPTNFTAYVYLNGNLVTTQVGFTQVGYYTVPLEKEVYLKKGDSFEIALKIFNEAPVYFPICTADEINKMTFERGISFYSVDGVNWNDFYESNKPGVLCIKAFTRPENLTEISIDIDQFSGGDSNPFSDINVGDLLRIQLNLPQHYLVDGIRHSLDGLVTFTINGHDYFAEVDNGTACLNITFEKEGTYDVAVQFKSSRVISNTVNFTLNVVKTAQSNLVIQASDVSKFYGGPERYVARLFNGNEPLRGAYVKVSVNGEDITVKSDDNGEVVLDLDLPVGAYDVYAQYGGRIAASKFTVMTTIEVNDVSENFLDSHVYASFLGTGGNALANADVSFSIEIYGVNSVPFIAKAITNKAGLASAKVNLYTGKYSVSVENPVSGEKKQFILEIMQADSECSLSVTQSGSAVTINATVSPMVASGYVNFLLLGNIYNVPVESHYVDNNMVAVASLRLDNLAIGTYEVSAVYTGDDNLRVSSDVRQFSVTKNPYYLHSGNYWGYYGASGTLAKITDQKGNPVKGEVVHATVLNKTYNSTTDENGEARFIMDLEVGNYTVLFEYKGQSLLKHLFVYSTISMADSGGEYMNSKVGAYFTYPYSGAQPATLDVKFIINGTEYSATTDSSGYASVDVYLPVGVHTITTVNLCNGEKKQSKITIYKTTPTVTLTKSKRGDGILLTASLSQPSAIGNVVFTMGSKKYTIAVIDGKAILAFNVLDEGSYDVYANYIGDYNFNNNLSSLLKFDYVHTDYSMSAPRISKYYGGPEKFTVTLYNFNRPLANAIINLTVDEKEYGIRTDSMGVATFDGNLNPGVHTVHCTYDDLTVLSEITVKSTVTIDSPTLDVSYSRIIAEICDGKGNPAANVAVTFKVGSKQFSMTTNVLGIVTLETDLDRGNYTVYTTNPVTGETKHSTLIITKSTPSLDLSVVKEYGLDVVKAVLPKAATGEVNFAFDNGDEYSIEIKDGVSSLEDLDPGDYTANVTYTGDDDFNPVSKIFTFTISKGVFTPLSSVLSVSKVTTTYGTSKNMVITLKDSKGNILAGRKITVKLNKGKYDAIMPSDGKAIVTVPSSLAAKSYTATVSYAGETYVLASSIKVSIVVNKVTPKLTASKKTFKVKDKTKKYVVTLKTNKNKAYKNQKITVNVKGKTYTAKTNSKGQATFKLTKLTKKGTFTAKVKYGGSSNYKAVSKSVKITVK